MNEVLQTMAAGTYSSTACKAVSKVNEGYYQEFSGYSIEVVLREDGSYSIHEEQLRDAGMRNEGDVFQIGIQKVTNDFDGTYRVGNPSGDDPNTETLLFDEAGYLGFFDKSDCSLQMWGLYPDAYLQYPCVKK